MVNIKSICFALMLLVGLVAGQKGYQISDRYVQQQQQYPLFRPRASSYMAQAPIEPVRYAYEPSVQSIEKRRAQLLYRTNGGYDDAGYPFAGY